MCHRILSVSRVTGTFQNISARSAAEKRKTRPQGMRLRNAWNVMKFSRVSAFYRVRFPLGNRRRETGQQMQFLTLCGNRVVKLECTTSGTASSTMKSSSWHASQQLVEKYSWFLSHSLIRGFQIFYHSRIARINSAYSDFQKYHIQRIFLTHYKSLIIIRYYYIPFLLLLKLLNLWIHYYCWKLRRKTTNINLSKKVNICKCSLFASNFLRQYELFQVQITIECVKRIFFNGTESIKELHFTKT